MSVDRICSLHRQLRGRPEDADSAPSLGEALERLSRCWTPLGMVRTGYDDPGASEVSITLLNGSGERRTFTGPTEVDAWQAAGAELLA